MGMMMISINRKGFTAPGKMFFLFLHDKLIHRDNDDEKGNQLTPLKEKKELSSNHQSQTTNRVEMFSADGNPPRLRRHTNHTKMFGIRNPSVVLALIITFNREQINDGTSIYLYQRGITKH